MHIEKHPLGGPGRGGRDPRWGGPRPPVGRTPGRAPGGRGKPSIGSILRELYGASLGRKAAAAE